MASPARRPIRHSARGGQCGPRIPPGTPPPSTMTPAMSQALPVPVSHRHSAAGASRGRLLVVLLLIGAFLLVEVIGSILTNSLALLADAGHMLTDAVGVGLALLAIWFARSPGHDRQVVRLLPAGDPGRCRQRRPAVRHGGLHPVRGSAAASDARGGFDAARCWSSRRSACWSTWCRSASCMPARRRA